MAVNSVLEDAALPPGDALPATALLPSFTDEELTILSAAPSLVVTPYLSSIAPRDREPLLRTAYRGLLARGIIDPPSIDARARARAEIDRAVEEPPGRAEDDDRPEVLGVDVAVRQDVAAMMTLRQAARAVVAVARTTALLQDYVYVHVVEDVLLIEEVSSDGHHRFALRDADNLGATVLAATVHPEAGDGAGEPAVLPPGAVGDPTPPAAVLEMAGLALLRCDLTVLTADDDATMLGLFTAPAGSWLFESAQGSGAPVHARPVAVAELRSAVLAELAILGVRDAQS